MRTLGITGRSGCGKSTVTALFRSHGVPVADADQIARDVLLPGSPLLPLLAERFGADIRNPDGTLNRHLLADRAFATPEGKAALDAITHPEIVARIRAAKAAAAQSGAELFVLDGAVIVGTGRSRVRRTAGGHGSLCGQCGAHHGPGWHPARNGRTSA